MKLSSPTILWRSWFEGYCLLPSFKKIKTRIFLLMLLWFILIPFQNFQILSSICADFHMLFVESGRRHDANPSLGECFFPGNSSQKQTCWRGRGQSRYSHSSREINVYPNTGWLWNSCKTQPGWKYYWFGCALQTLFSVWSPCFVFYTLCHSRHENMAKCQPF